MIDAGADNVHVAERHPFVCPDYAFALGPKLNAFGNLSVPMLNAVTQPDRFDAPVFVASPGVHRHGIGIIEEERARFGDSADVLTDIQQNGDRSLPVHDAAGANGIANTLVDAVLQGNIDIQSECIEAALPDHGYDVVGAGNCLAPVQRGSDCGRQSIGSDISLAQLRHHG